MCGKLPPTKEGTDPTRCHGNLLLTVYYSAARSLTDMESGIGRGEGVGEEEGGEGGKGASAQIYPE